MPNNDLDVFDHLCSDEDTNIEIDYLTYAVFAYKKSHWIDRFEELNHRKPNQKEIDQWIKELTEYDYTMMRTDAAEFFDTAASEYMKNEIERARIRGKEEAIAVSVAQMEISIKNIASVRGQLLIALLTAVLVPPILGGFIFGVRQFEAYMPTITTFMFSANPPAGRPSPLKQPE